jgi:hypothetical protein
MSCDESRLQEPGLTGGVLRRTILIAPNKPPRLFSFQTGRMYRWGFFWVFKILDALIGP